jgi:hypothetical protein
MRMSEPHLTNPGRRWTAAELLRLPPDKRDAILRAAAELAEPDYRNDPELTAFDAFDPILETPTEDSP